MYHRLAVQICEYFNRRSGEEKSNLNVAIYGCELLISSGVTVILLLCIGGFMNHFLDTIIFLAFYCPLRQYSGGYHATNYRNCTMCFCIIYFGILCIPSNIPMELLILGGVIASIIIWILAPVEDQNKPLSKEEVIYLKRKSKSILCIEILIILLMLVVKKGVVNPFPFYAIICVSTLLWIGDIKNKIIMKKVERVQRD